MGLFCVNFHARGVDSDSVADALLANGVSDFHVLPAKSGWSSFYERQASQQDDSRIRRIATEVSRRLQSPVIAFLVHDSDIACYWLLDKGRLLDEFNSCPDYFEADASDGSPSGGEPNVLAPYCRPGTNPEQLADLLSKPTLFAEGLVESLAESLGIDVERALSDYRDIADGEGPDDLDSGSDFDDDGNGSDGDGPAQDEDDDEPRILPLQKGLMSKLTRMISGGEETNSDDPVAAELVSAAANGEIVTLERLISSGIEIDSIANMPILEQLAGLSGVFPGGLPSVTPLLAAVLRKQIRAATVLLTSGADANYCHPIFGTPLHVAAGAGDVETVQLLLNYGADPTRLNHQGKSALEVLKTSQAAWKKLAETQIAMKSLGFAMPAVMKNLPVSDNLEQGWRDCERLLNLRPPERGID